MQLTIEQRVFIVRKYHETRSLQTVREAFRAQFPNRNPPSNSTIQKNVRKYQIEGTSQNLNKGRSGRRRTTRDAQTINNVRLLLQANRQPQQPRVTCRRNPLGIPKSAFNRITKSDIKWHPYKMKVVQELKPGDYARRMRFCNWFSARAPNVRFMSSIVIGDEAVFSMDGTVNTQNIRCYAPKGQPPGDFKYEKSQSREKLHVWVGLCGNGKIIGPHFFNRNVNGRTYRDMLERVAFPAVAHIYYHRFQNGVFNDVWWFQYGAPPHGSLQVRQTLRQRFEDRVVALHHNVEWPPRSPDLTPLDFFLWGYLKNKVYQTPPPDLATVRRRIVDEVNLLRRKEPTIRSCFAEMTRRVNVCIARNGSHVEC